MSVLWYGRLYFNRTLTMNKIQKPDHSHRIERHITSDEEVVSVIVTTIAEATNVAVDEMPPLQETLDGDALNTIFTFKTDDEPAVILFEYADCTVRYYSDQIIVVTPATRE